MKVSSKLVTEFRNYLEKEQGIEKTPKEAEELIKTIRHLRQKMSSTSQIDVWNAISDFKKTTKITEGESKQLADLMLHVKEL